MVDTNKEKNTVIDAGTYVFIDVSNIRQACKKCYGFNIDFFKFYDYFSGKYKNLKDVRYYEGVAFDDSAKKEYFEKLRAKGFTVCSLERKTYTERAKRKKFVCPKCSKIFLGITMPATTKMKSNVDVYLVSELLELAAKDKKPKRIILVSCDGDYAEAIKAAVRINPNIVINVLATSFMKKNNYLSVRLKDIAREIDKSHYRLDDISKISNKISG